MHSKSVLKRLCAQYGFPVYEAKGPITGMKADWIIFDDMETKMHPKAAEHANQREAAAENERIKRANLDLWTKSLNLRFVHVREEFFEDISIKGGMTVAFSLPKSRYKRLIPVAVSYVHPNDVFCKREGRYYAARDFYNGKIIDVRIPKTWELSPATFIKKFFKGLI